MKRKSKSVGVELKKKKTYQAQQRLLSNWVQNWNDDQINVIKQLEYAARNNIRGDVFHMIDQLKGMTDKRFIALNNVLSIISDPDRELLDERDRLDYIDNDICDNDLNDKMVDDVDITEEVTLEEKTDEKEVKEKVKCSIGCLDRTPNINIKETKDIDIEEIVKGYKSGMPMSELCQWNGMSRSKIIKILITEGVYTNETYDRIKDMRENGKSDWEIMDRLDINKNTLNMYTPYKKAIYNLDNASVNAKRIRKSRQKRVRGDIECDI